MTAPIDLILSRLPDAKPTGRDRWRWACPVCGEKNRSTLSVGVGDNGAVLLKCFKSECSPDQIAKALGLELTDLFPAREAYSGPLKQRRLLSAQQALDVLVTESGIIRMVAADMRANKTISKTDWSLLDTAFDRVERLSAEVHL